MGANPVFLDLPPSIYAPAWLGGGSCRAILSCCVCCRMTLGFKGLKCHLQLEKWLNHKCILCFPSSVTVCNFFFFFKYYPLLWPHILKCPLSHLVTGIPWFTTQKRVLSSLSYARKAPNISKVSAQSIKSLIGRPKAWFGTHRSGNSKSHCPDTLSFSLSFFSLPIIMCPHLISPISLSLQHLEWFRGCKIPCRLCFGWNCSPHVGELS